MFSKLSAILLIVAMLFVIGCAAHTHKVGKGAPGSTHIVSVERQWYVVWGLVPINSVDTNAMAGGATDYEIKTSITPVDFLINAIGSYVTVHARTVTVRRTFEQ